MLKRVRAYLSVIFAIFKRDIWRVLRNPIALIVTLGMIFMPSAYAWYVIAANWDPYSNTESMYVAVANQDAGYNSEQAGQLNIGDQVVEQLHDNHTIGWQFTDRESAINGVYSGEYWAALVIPEDFSEDFASVLTGDFTQPVLDYYVNEKLSSVAPKVTDAAANAVEKAINENFIKTVTETVVSTTQDAGKYTEDKASDAESSLSAGVKSASETVAQTRETFDGLASTADKARNGVTQAENSLTNLQDSLPQLLEAIAQTKTLLSKARSTTNSYGAELAQNATTAALKLSEAATAAQKALGTLTGDIAAAESNTRAALTQAQSLLATNQRLIDDLTAQASQAGAPAAISQALTQAQQANDRISSTVSTLSSALESLTSTADALESEGQALIEATQTASSTLQEATNTFQSTILPNITSNLDTLVETCSALEGAVRGLSPTISQAKSALSGLSETLETAGNTLAATSESLSTMQENLDRTLTDLTALQNSATINALAEYLKADPDEIGTFMAQPVQLKTEAIYAVNNYGSGVAPFFTNLALWVAGFILMAMVKLRVDPAGLPKFTATQAYFGRWLFYIVAGLLMGLVCCLGDLVIGIQCENPVAFVAAGLLTVFVDVNLMYGLAYSMRHVGKAVGVLLLIMQIPGSSGMFPIQMMPKFFQVIHPLLPFTYSIDTMRECIGGFYGLDYLWDMLCLALLFLPLGFLVGIGLGKADFNLTLMFDTKLGATDLFVTEPITENAKSNAESSPIRYRTRTLLKALLNTDNYRQIIMDRTEWFSRNYPRLRRIGWLALIVQPLLTFAIMVLIHANVNTRITMLIGMVVGIIVVDAYLMIISYANTSLSHNLALANMSVEDLHDQAAQLGLTDIASKPRTAQVQSADASGHIHADTSTHASSDTFTHESSANNQPEDKQEYRGGDRP